jgi:hypothetical protein
MTLMAIDAKVLHRAKPPLWPRLALVPTVAALTLLGIWVTGGLLTDDFKLSMALTALWLASAGGVALLIAWRRRNLALPVLGTFVVTAGVVGGYLAYTTMIDRVVDERVAVAGIGGSSEVRRGAFSSGAHETSGTATVVELSVGSRVLTLTRFETSPGPDLRVYLTRTPDDASNNVDLGGLKGNRGDQQYPIPPQVDLERYSTVVIWCRAFSVNFGTARLS